MKKIIALILVLTSLICLISCNDSKSKSTNSKEDEEFIIGQNSSKKETESTQSTKTIYFETNGGSKISPMTVSGEHIQFPTPTKENYTFEGWFLNAELTNEPTYPIKIESDTTLYAKWIKTQSFTKYKDTQLKNWKNNYNTSTFFITPNGFDMQELEANGYRMKITATYDIYYEKDYDTLLDIGYAGAPKYDVSIEITDTRNTRYIDQVPSTQSKTKTISYDSTIADIKNQQIDLIFSTENIQNTIFIKNITVTYECYKQ